jgi:hypothetical protein
MNVELTEAFVGDFGQVTRLLRKYWPGVVAKIGRDDGIWNVCIQPGELLPLGRTPEEVERYLGSHPMTREQQMAEFQHTITCTMRTMGVQL